MNPKENENIMIVTEAASGIIKNVKKIERNHLS